MKSETKTCQNCKQQFVIEPEDFDFYKKMKVPTPTWCWECRARHKYTFRNERTLYRRACDLTGKEIISQYGEGVLFPVYETRAFYAQKYDVPSLEYDPTRSFFEQLKNLSDIVPRPALLTDIVSAESNSVYQNASSRNKNCYMVFASGDNEDCMYGTSVDYSKTCVDCLWTRECAYCYECIDCFASNNLFFCHECRHSVSSYFLSNCRNCTNCFGCVNLHNKSYCYFNKQLSKEEYGKTVRLILENLIPERIADIREKVYALSLRLPKKFAHATSTVVNSTGDFLWHCKNVHQCFQVYESENCKYCVKLIKGTLCYDVNDWGDPAELCYECITVGKNAYRCLFSNNCWPACRDVQYCDTCTSSENLFGCIGLIHASYCILNKKYDKASYKTLKEKIISNMLNRGEYGLFFPAILSPFAYNETIAQEYFPLTKGQAIEQGYSWKDPETKEYEVTIKSEALPDCIKDVKDDILEQVIGCEHEGKCNEQCTTAFKIIPDELQFYRKMNLALPRLCPNCRHYQRLKQRNPLKLWHRKCQCAGEKSDNNIYKNTVEHFHKSNHCPNEFETTYAPERKEIVYCEKCYQQEIV